MPHHVLRADLGSLDKIAGLFDAYRVFYQQPSNLPQSWAFLAERLSANESVIFYVQTAEGQALGFV